MPARPRFTGRAVILVVLAVLMVSYASSMRAYLEQRHHIDDLRDQIVQSQKDIDALEREKKRWSDPAYVARWPTSGSAGCCPGEIGFQVIDDNGKPLGSTDRLSDPDRSCTRADGRGGQAVRLAAAGRPSAEGAGPARDAHHPGDE